MDTTAGDALSGEFEYANIINAYAIIGLSASFVYAVTNSDVTTILYTIGPFATSLGWSRGLYQGLAVANATSILDTYEAIVNYVLGPGVAVGAAIQLDYYRSGTNAAAGGVDNAGGLTNNYHDAVLEVGTRFNF
jgi:uncharacterized membrane protein YqgA involved in biofilm formation